MTRLEEIIESADNRAEIRGCWVPARPVNWKYRSLFCRLKESWMVFTGEADCFIWPMDQ